MSGWLNSIVAMACVFTSLVVTNGEDSQPPRPNLGKASPSTSAESAGQPADQLQLVVARDGSGDFRSLGEAIAQASPKTRVVVRPGIYRESLIVDKCLDVVGDGPRCEIIVQPDNACCLYLDTKRAVIRGLTLRCRGGGGKKCHAVEIASGAPVVEDCDLTSDSLSALAIHGSDTNPLVRDCWIRESKDAGVLFYDEARGTLENCEIFNNLVANVSIEENSHPVLRRCRIHHGKAEGVAVYTGGQGTLEECHIFSNQRNVYSEVEKWPSLVNCRVDPGRLDLDCVTSNFDEQDDDVDPAMQEIVLTFAEPMDTGAWHISERGIRKYGDLPEIVGEPGAFFHDERTFVIRVQLEPNHRYAFGLNDEQLLAFQSAKGVPLEPVIFYFRTGDPRRAPPTSKEVRDLFSAYNSQRTPESFLKVRRAVMAHEDFDPTPLHTDVLASLLGQKHWQEARRFFDVTSFPNLLLSPWAWALFATAEDEGNANRDASRLAGSMAKALIESIIETGDGSRERPYEVLNSADAEAILAYRLQMRESHLKLFPAEGKLYVRATCSDGTEVWFERLRPSGQTRPPALARPVDSGGEINRLYAAYVREPTNDNFLNLRKAVVAHEDYQRQNLFAAEMLVLVEKRKYREAERLFDETMPNLLICPIAWSQLGSIARSEGNVPVAGVHENFGRMLGRSILDTGDGSRERPYLMTNFVDQTVIMGALGKHAAHQETIDCSDKLLKKVNCQDGTVLWFDVTECVRRVADENTTDTTP
jgi:hypothetical protein